MKKFSALLFVLIIAFSSSSAFAAEKIKYSQDIANAVRSFLVNDDWKFDFNADRGVFNFGLNIDGKLGKLDYSIRVRENFFTVYAVAPINADRKDPKAMAAMAEFITRANYGLPNGNFEMDVNDGEIRYKCYVNVKGMNDISDDIIDDSIKLPALMIDRYGDGMAALMFGFSDPATEIQKVENN